MIRQIPWTRVVAEGLVIVVSILMAFAIDAGWEEYSERREVQLSLGQVRDELLADRPGMVGTAGGHIAAALAGFTVAELLGQAPPGTMVTVPDTLLARMVGGGTWESQSPTLIGLIQTGRASSIEDPRILTAIAAWERWVQNTEEHQARVTNLTDQQLFPALATRADVGHLARSMAPHFMRDGDDVQGLPPPPQLDPTGVTLVQADRQLEALISRRAEAAGVSRSSLLLVIASTDSLVAAIASALDH